MSRSTKGRTHGSAELHQDLPLARDEAERILRAPASERFPLPADWDERIEYLAPALIRLTIRIADLSIPTYIGISPEDLAEARRAKAALAELQTISAACGEWLPARPKRWAERYQAAVESRISLADLDKRKRARPAMHHHEVAYHRLLAFYATAYGRTPRRSFGPAHRFLAAWFRTTVKYLTRATAPSQPGLSTPKWKVPSDASLEERVVKYRKVPTVVQREVNDLIDACKRQLMGSARVRKAGSD